MLTKRLTLTVLATACCVFPAVAEEPPSDRTRRPYTPSTVPRPVTAHSTLGVFPILPSTRILVPPGNAEVKAIAQYLAARLCRATGFDVEVEASENRDQADTILLALDGFSGDAIPPADVRDEAYQLVVRRDRAMLNAENGRGLFRGVQTFRQLLPPQIESATPVERDGWRIRCAEIMDYPRYRWRGMLLDCCRHYMTPEFVKRYIDLLAYHKMNVLHWHLTEDQGWRIEIKKYPKLTEIGAWRGEGEDRHGGFYTQEEVREIVAYAASRYITVVPEIEMPGHSQAALAGYPELSCTGGPFKVGTRWGVYPDVYCAGNEQVLTFLEDVLGEVLELFPSEFIHIGGDECPKIRWERCPKCQARIKAEGLRNERELQSYFIRRMERFLNARGRRLVGWDEILEGGLAPNATVQSWRGMRGAVAAARAGHDVISSPTSHCYLDYSHDAISLARIYSFEPTPVELTPEQAKHILGAEGNIWTELAPQSRVDHQVFPRLCALAEVTWSPKNLRDWDNFSERMREHYLRLDELGVTYYIAPPRFGDADTIFAESSELVLTTTDERGTIRYTLDGSEPTLRSPLYKAPVQIDATTLVRTRTFIRRDRFSDIAERRFVKQEPRDAVKVAHTIPGLKYSYYEGDWPRLPDFDTLTPLADGLTPGVDLSVRRRDNYYAVRFSGYVDIPADGVYAFYLASDDDSRLWIGADLVVDHDAQNRPGELEGRTLLRAGKHPITVALYNSGGRQRLGVDYAGPGIAKQAIPASVLFTDRETSPTEQP